MKWQYRNGSRYIQTPQGVYSLVINSCWMLIDDTSNLIYALSPIQSTQVFVWIQGTMRVGPTPFDLVISYDDRQVAQEDVLKAFS